MLSLQGATDLTDTSGRNTRLDAVIPVRFADAREFLVEYSSNISMGGVFVRTSSPAAFGTVVRLSLELPGTNQAVPVMGQVAFVLPPEQAARQGKVPGMGVRFTRLDSAVEETLASYVAGLQKKSKGRVLLVDDDPLILHQLADLLRKQNLNVVTASSAVKALEVVRFGGIDFVISDIQMPRMDGFEFRDNLRNSPRTASIPFVFLTSSINEGDRQIAAELGVTAFLVKPCDEAALLGLLRDMLGPDSVGGVPAAPDAPGTATLEAPRPEALPPPPVISIPPPATSSTAADADAVRARRRVVEIAYRKFVALGLDTRFTQDETGVFGQLVFRTVTLQDPITGQRLERAGLYGVGHDRAKLFWPRTLATLPLMHVFDIPDGASLERLIASAYQKKLDELRAVKQFLDRLRIENRFDPATLRVLGQVKVADKRVTFSLRDPQTVFLEAWDGRSFGAIAPLLARLVDLRSARDGEGIARAIEAACQRLTGGAGAVSDELVLEEEVAPPPGLSDAPALADLAPAGATPLPMSAIQEADEPSIESFEPLADDEAPVDPFAMGESTSPGPEPFPATEMTPPAPDPELWDTKPEDELAPETTLGEHTLGAALDWGETSDDFDAVETTAETPEKTPEPPAPAAPRAPEPPPNGHAETVPGLTLTPLPPRPPASPAEEEARKWADEWTGDESSAAPLWAMQPTELSVPTAAPSADLQALPTSPIQVGAAAEEAAAEPEAAPPAAAGDSTVLICNNCGEYYSIGESVDDERLLLLCPACLAKGA